jgi:cellulose synthase (UDP-forming)
VPRDPAARAAVRLALLRLIIATNLILAIYYLTWRYARSINWVNWWIAVPLLAAETYSFVDTALFCLSIWKLRVRGEPPPPPEHARVDVFICTYNEPVELVRKTARAAQAIRYPHITHILDDGARPEMRKVAEEEGVDYLSRSREWQNMPRHAKAGNIVNALYQTSGEFILFLDADQIASPEILDRTLGYFRDPQVGFLQTTQYFYNVPKGDPFGSQAPLFYGPIQQGKDGWNAAFFCGSNAVVRREALMQVGIRSYIRELDGRVRRTLRAAVRMLRTAERGLPDDADPRFHMGLRLLQMAVRDARRALRAGGTIQEVTWEFQRCAEEVANLFVMDDLAEIRAELAGFPDLGDTDPASLDDRLADIVGDDAALKALTGRTISPLAAIGVVRELLMVVDVDRSDEAHPVMPMATISVTEDMATAMRMHALGWKSVYSNETHCVGLAPEDLGTALQQRLRWAQGTIQVLLRENPLVQQGLSLAQRLMYFGTMWSYLSGFFAVVYLMAPICYLFFGWMPVHAYSSAFFRHLLPYLIVNQILFVVVSWGRPTWRGRQHSLALFPIWITAVTSAVGSVYFGRKLAFAVTPKTRQTGVFWRLVRWQIAVMALLAAASLFGLARLTLGLAHNGAVILINVFWAVFDIVMLWGVITALLYQPADEEPDADAAPQTDMTAPLYPRLSDARGNG